MTFIRRVLLVTASIVALGAMLAGCACFDDRENQNMSATPTDSSAAKSEWLDLARKTVETQNLVGGSWEVSDSNADDCGDGGALWGISRLGPGVPEAERSSLFDRVETAWRAYGWKAARMELRGDAPGLQLRFPATGSLDDGFFVEFASTVHGTTIGAQTACAAGDVDQLNREQFAFNNTPGYTPTPSTP